MNKLLVSTTALKVFICMSVLQANGADESADLHVIHTIKDQALLHSKVMDYMHIIADENGPRLSGSPGYTRAAKLAVETLKAEDIKRTTLESWGVFGRGWSWSRIAVQMKKPQETTLSAFPADWSGATDGPVSGCAECAFRQVLRHVPENNGKRANVRRHLAPLSLGVRQLQTCDGLIHNSEAFEISVGRNIHILPSSGAVFAG